MNIRKSLQALILLFLPLAAMAQQHVDQAFATLIGRNDIRWTDVTTQNSNPQAATSDYFVRTYRDGRLKTKAARELIDNITSAAGRDADRLAALTFIDARSSLNGSVFARAVTPAGERVLGGMGENVLCIEYREHHPDTTLSVTNALQWRELPEGDCLMSVVLSAVAKPSATRDYYPQGKAMPPHNLYAEMRKAMDDPAVGGAPYIRMQRDAQGRLTRWETAYTFSCSNDSRTLLDKLIAAFTSHKDKPNYMQRDYAHTVRFFVELSDGLSVTGNTREGGRYAAVSLPADEQGYVYDYYFFYVRSGDKLEGHAVARLRQSEGIVPKPRRDAEMDTLLVVLSDKESGIDFSTALLQRGVSFEGLRLQAEADCEGVQIMRQAQAEELQVAADVYRSALSEAKAAMETMMTQVRENYERTKQTATASVRAGKMHHGEYEGVMRDAATAYAQSLDNLTRQYKETVDKATKSYDEAQRRIAATYASRTTLFPEGKPCASIDNTFRQLCAAYRSDGSNEDACIAAKLKRLIQFAKPKLNAAIREQWRTTLPANLANLLK